MVQIMIMPKNMDPCFVNSYWVGLEKHCFLIWRKMGNFREMIICFKLPICKTQQQAPKYLIRACLLYVVNVTQMFDLISWLFPAQIMLTNPSLCWSFTYVYTFLSLFFFLLVLSSRNYSSDQFLEIITFIIKLLLDLPKSQNILYPHQWS